MVTRIGECHHITIANITIQLCVSRGAKDFLVSVSNSEDGPWTEFKNGTLEDPAPNCPSAGDLNPIVEFDANLVNARYVQFQCLTYYKGACALNFIEVYYGPPSPPTTTTTTTAPGTLNR